MSEDAKKINVTVRQLTGKSLSVDLNPSDTVKDLAKKIINTKSFCNVKSLRKNNVIGFELMFYTKVITSSTEINKKISEFSFNNKQSIAVVIRYVVFGPGADPESIGESAVLFDNILQELKSKEQNEKIESKQSSWPWQRIIIGVIDLLLLAAAGATFLLNFHLAVLIVLVALFVIDAILFFGWNTILPKNCLIKMDLNTNLYKEANEDKEKEEIQEENLEPKKGQEK